MFFSVIYLFPPKPFRQGHNEYWYRPVLFSRNEGCTPCFARRNFMDHRTLIQARVAVVQDLYWSRWATLPPAVRLSAAKLTTDGDAQLHSSPLRKLNVEGATAGNHRLWQGFRVNMNVGSHKKEHICAVRNDLNEMIPATSNSTSTATLLARAESLSSWWASSRVPSSVGIPLMDNSLSPTCSSPHLHREKEHGMSSFTHTAAVY